MNDHKPGILVVNTINYTGEYLGTIEGTRYFAPFMASNRNLAESIVDAFNKSRAFDDEAYNLSMETVDAESVQEALYGCRMVQRFDSSSVDIVVADRAITAAQLRDMETNLKDPVYENLSPYTLQYKLDDLFNKYWGKYKNQIGHPSY